MTVAFVNSAASRDFASNTYQMVFATPLKKFDYLTGRYLGSALIAVIPMLGVSIGIIVGKWMPWVDPERWGAGELDGPPLRHSGVRDSEHAFHRRDYFRHRGSDAQHGDFVHRRPGAVDRLWGGPGADYRRPA